MSPDGIIISTDSSITLLPSSEGEIGILAEHIPIITKLNPGVIKIFKTEKDLEYETFIFGGFARFEKNTLNILVQKNCDISKLEKDKALSEMSDLESELMNTNDLKEIDFLFEEILLRQKIIENAS